MREHKLDFASRVAAVNSSATFAGERVEHLMLNVGRRCDLACAHCHLSCSPSTHETMDAHTMLASVELAETLRPALVDITGGSPELWPHLRELVSRLRLAGVEIRMRTNLVALESAQARGLAEFLAEQRVGLLASLPGTSSAQVARQRGDVFAGSIEVLRRLGTLGYGSAGGPALEIAYNPPLGELPSAEEELEARFAEFFSTVGVGAGVGRVRAIANVPVGRFGDALARTGGHSAYLHRLADRFNPLAVDGLACKSGVEVAWDGRLYDCDFNLGAGVPAIDGPRTVHEALLGPDALLGRKLAFGAHCFACTAGAGSG